MHVCGVCVGAFCGVVLPGCVVWAGVVGGCISPRLAQLCMTFNRRSSAPGSRRPRARSAAGRAWSTGPMALQPLVLDHPMAPFLLDPFLLWVHWAVIVAIIGCSGAFVAICRLAARVTHNILRELFRFPTCAFLWLCEAKETISAGRQLAHSSWVDESGDVQEPTAAQRLRCTAFDLFAMTAYIFLHGFPKSPYAVRKSNPNNVRGLRNTLKSRKHNPSQTRGTRDIRDKLGCITLATVSPTPRRKSRGGETSPPH